MNETPKAGGKAGDIRELQYRISQLEHLFVNQTINSPTINSSLPSDDSLHQQTHNALIERISDLEGLLAASELDNQNIRHELAVLDMDKKRDDMILLEKLYAKDREVERLNNEVQLLETKLQKSERTIENVKEYINTLPSQDELDEARDNISKLDSDNHVMRKKIQKLEQIVSEQEKEINTQKKLLEDQKIRLDAVQPLEEAQDSILRNFEEGSLSLQDEKLVSELITVQKAQILRSSKLVTTLREKLNAYQAKQTSLQEKISSQDQEIKRLEDELMVNQLTMEKTCQNLKSVEQERLGLIEEKAKLQGMIEDRDNFIHQRDTQFANILKLVTEIDLCVTDVKKLVELGESISKGEEPPVASLLGLSEELEMHLLSINEEPDYDPWNCTDLALKSLNLSGSGKHERSLAKKYLASVENGVSLKSEPFSIGDMEWALDRIKKIRDLRVSIGQIRDQVNDLYTDMVGGKVEGCNVQ